MRLKAASAIVTGAGAGMGRAIATLFAAEGARLVVNDYDRQRVREVVEEIQEAGGEVIGMAGDVADQSHAEALVDRAEATFGRVDVLCNNAGVNDQFHGVADVSNEIWERILAINLNGPMYTSRRAVPIMTRQGGGSIINIASAAGLGGGLSGCAYTVSKHALLGLTRSTAWMYAKQGVRCNAICPGGVKTRIFEDFDGERADRKALERVTGLVAFQPRMGVPNDIARLALFLASDDSSFINGAVIPADAGFRAA